MGKKERFYEFRKSGVYEEALKQQGFLTGEGFQGLIAIEPENPILLGRFSSKDSVEEITGGYLRNSSAKVIPTDCGEDLVFLNSGQLVGFPLVDLWRMYEGNTSLEEKLKSFSDELLMSMAHACATMGVKNVRIQSETKSIFTAKGKLAGVHLIQKQGIVLHGFYLNVRSGLRSEMQFQLPLGTESFPATCLEQECQSVQSVENVAERILPYFSFCKNDSPMSPSGAPLNTKETQRILVSAISKSEMAMEQFFRRSGSED